MCKLVPSHAHTHAHAHAGADVPTHTKKDGKSCAFSKEESCTGIMLLRVQELMLGQLYLLDLLV